MRQRKGLCVCVILEWCCWLGCQNISLNSYANKRGAQAETFSLLQQCYNESGFIVVFSSCNCFNLIKYTLLEMYMVCYFLRLLRSIFLRKGGQNGSFDLKKKKVSDPCARQIGNQAFDNKPKTSDFCDWIPQGSAERKASKSPACFYIRWDIT